MPSIADVTKDQYESLSSTDKQDIRDDVLDQSSTGWSQIADDKIDRAIKKALSERDTLYSDRVSRMPTLDGDAEEFSLLLAAHNLELWEGGEAQSESNQGGNVSYNTVTGESLQQLTQTRYGREAMNHVRDRQGLGIQRSRY